MCSSQTRLTGPTISNDVCDPATRITHVKWSGTAVLYMVLAAKTMRFYFPDIVLKWEEESSQGLAEIKEVCETLGSLALTYPWPGPVCPSPDHHT